MARADPPVTKAGRKASRLWWYVHHWTGLKLSLFLAFICLTGTIATLAHEIDWLLHPTLRVSASSGDAPVAWDRIAARAAAYRDVAEILTISNPVAGAFAARVTVRRGDDSLGYLHAHPVTGVIQGEQGFVDTQRIFRNLHRHLNLPTKIGVPIVSMLSLLLLVSFVTSFVVYKKWWRGFFKPLRLRSARVALGDFHRLAGVWSLWFVLLIAVTGLWYLVESLGGDAPAMPKADVTAIERPLPQLAASLPLALANARRAAPDLVIESIRFPSSEQPAFVIEGQRSAWLVRARANAVWADASAGRVVLVTDGRYLGVHQRISEMADPLHFGTFGGYWTKVLWFVAGLTLTALCVSGAAIYGLRIARGVLVRRIWLGMGHWRWLSVAAVLTGFVMLPTLFLPD
jgi:uncharacterized iron-regulated membrane protein